MQGWIKINRSLLDNSIFNNEPYTRGQAWITLLLLTNYKKGYITVKNGDMLKIERGECGYSELALADIFKWSRGKLKRFLKLLEGEKMIQQKIVSKHSIIKVLNYEKYQIDTTNDTTNDTTDDTTDGHKRKKDKKEKKDNTHTNKGVCVNLSKEEKEILAYYARKSNARNIDAYVNSLIKNGGYAEILQKEKDRQQKLRERENQLRQQSKEITRPKPPNPEEEAEIAAIQKRIRERLGK